jgi:hypothetical protein
MMDCEKLRERLAADPARVDQEFDRHAESCSPCRAFRERLMRAEALIQSAVRFDVAAAAGRVESARVERATRSNWVTFIAGVAASALVAVTLWAFFADGRFYSNEALAVEVAEHWYHEPDAWVTSNVDVGRADLIDVLAGKAEIDLGLLSTVSYAESCRVAGEWVPHLIVQGSQGPYMVLLMPGRRLESPIPLELPAEGLSGQIFPVGDGSIAVLGGDSAETDEIQRAVRSAVEWTI